MKKVSLPFDYDRNGSSYSQYRREDPRIAEQILGSLDNARTVLNVGAGAGSYEPQDRFVIAVEPSETMRSQRVSRGRGPAVNARADHLPFDDRSFDASMAVLTIHHWDDIERGLAELKRVTRRRVIIITYDPDALDVFWNVHYFKVVVETERKRYPSIRKVLGVLGGEAKIRTVTIPFDCTDGFQEAFYGRPEAFLDANVRRNQSAWGLIDSPTEARLIERFQEELSSGEWDRKYGQHRTLPTFDGALRIVAVEYGR